jgi:O-antigen/teichoic acid export membrane protein
LSLAGLTLCVYITRSIVIGVAGYALIWVVVLFTYDMRSAFIILRNLPPEAGGVADGGHHHMVFIRPRWMFRNMARIIGISLPLGLATMLNSLNFNIPRYFISSYWGERELGFFSAMAYVQVAGTIVVGALAISALPRLTKYYAEGNRRSFLVLSTRLLCISIVLGLGGIAIAAIAGKPLLIYFYRPEYAEHISVFIGMMTVAGATYVAASLQNVLIAVRAFNVQLPLFAVLAIVTTVASALLVPSSGMQGAVIAQLISALVQVLLSLVLAARAIHHMRSESV